MFPKRPQLDEKQKAFLQKKILGTKKGLKQSRRRKVNSPVRSFTGKHLMCVVGNRPKQTTVPWLISGSTIMYLVGASINYVDRIQPI